MKKKILALVMASAMALSLAACGSSGGSSTPAASSAAGSAAASAPATETYTIGICQLVQHPALDAATQGFRDAVDEALPGQVTWDEQCLGGQWR